MAFTVEELAISTAVAPLPGTGAGTLNLASGEGSDRFPNPSTYGNFKILIEPDEGQPTPENSEIALVTARAGDALTLGSRAQNGSTARDVQAGDHISMLLGPSGSSSSGGGMTTVSDTHANRIAASHVANRFWKETDTGLIYLDDGTNWIIWKDEGTVRKTADETVQNNTLQNDDHLKFPIEPNEVWFVEAFLKVRSVSVNSDFLVGWNFSAAGMTATWDLNGPQGTWGAVALATTVPTARGIAGSRAQGSANGDYGVLVAGWFENGANAGTLNLQWAQNTTTAEDTKVLTNSNLRIRRLV